MKLLNYAKDVAGLQAESKSCKKPTLACACRKPRNNQHTHAALHARDMLAPDHSCREAKR